MSKRKRTDQTPKKPGAIVDATAAAKARALKAYERLHTVSHACQAAGLARSTWYEWLEADPAFAAAVHDATERVLDELERTAFKRATKSSDTLTIFLLKSLRRRKFGDKQIITLTSPEVQVAMQQTIQLIASRPTWDSEDLLAQIQPFWK